MVKRWKRVTALILSVSLVLPSWSIHLTAAEPDLPGDLYLSDLSAEDPAAADPQSVDEETADDFMISSDVLDSPDSVSDDLTIDLTEDLLSEDSEGEDLPGEGDLSGTDENLLITDPDFEENAAPETETAYFPEDEPEAVEEESLTERAAGEEAIPGNTVAEEQLIHGDGPVIDPLADEEDLSDMVLTGDATIEGNAIISYGTLQLNGHTLTINGSLLQDNGNVDIGGGTLIVTGNYVIMHRVTPYVFENNSAVLIMGNEADYVRVDGGFYSYGESRYSDETDGQDKDALTAGTLEVKGDCFWHNFKAYGTHRVLFAGDAGQKVTVSGNDSFFHLIEAPDGHVLSWDGNLSIDGLGNDMVIEPAGTDITLSHNGKTSGLGGHNLTIQGNIQRISGTFVIGAGNTLTVQGDLLQGDGNLLVDGGTLHVTGDYRIQNGTFMECSGALIMKNDSDYVLVEGDFYPAGAPGYWDETDGSFKPVLSAGVLELRGDIPESGDNWNPRLNAGGTHRLFLNGGADQHIYLEEYDSGIQYLKTAQDCVPVWDGTFYVRYLDSDLTVQPGPGGISMLYNYQSRLDFNGHHMTVQGDLGIHDGTITVGAGGSLTVEGNLHQELGALILEGASLHVKGDYRLQHRSSDGSYETCIGSSALVMNNENDYALIEGDFYPGGGPYYTVYTGDYGDYRDALTAGVLELKGNIPDGSEKWQPNLVTKGTHKLLLSGGTGQKISLPEDSYLRLHSLEVADGTVPEWNGYFDVEQLDSDVTLQSPDGIMLMSSDRTLNFNGHDLTVLGNIWGSYGEMIIGAGRTFTVDGNVIQRDGRWFLDGGTLHVTGDYRIQAPDPYLGYRWSNGLLVMRNDEDHVIVEGDFHAGGDYYYIEWPENEGEDGQVIDDVLSAGVMEIKGDFYQEEDSRGFYNSFHAVGTHRVILNGDQLQFVYFQSDGSGFAELEVTGDPGSYAFNRIPCWDCLFKDGERQDDASFGDFAVSRGEDGNGTGLVINAYTGSSYDLEVPDSLYGYPVTEIGDMGLANLQCDTIRLPKSLTRIGSGAFSNCVNLTELEIPSGISEIPFNTLGGCSHLERLILPRSVTQIEDSCAADLRHTTLYVYKGSYSEQYAIENQLDYEYLSEEQMSSLSIRVLDETGTTLESGFSVYWCDGKTEAPLGTGQTLQNTVPGKSYRCEVLLDEELNYSYRQPEERIITAEETDLTQDIVLEKIGRITLQGTVKNAEDEGIEAAQLSFRQMYDSGYTKTVSVQTDEAGAFSAVLDDVRSSAVISADGYYNEYLAFDGDLEDETALEIILRKVPADRIALSLSRRRASEPAAPAETVPLDSFNNLSFSVFNETKDTAVTDFTAQYPYIYLNESSSDAGDVIRLSVTDAAQEMSADDLQVTLDENRCGSAEWTLTENGAIQLTNITGNGDQVVMLFDGQQSLAENKIVRSSYRSKALTEGTYTCVIMNRTSLLRRVDVFERLAEYGLSENTDFALRTVSVEKGIITVVDDVEVPDFDESRLYYTVESNTRIWSAKSTVAAGQYLDVRVMYEIDEKYDSTGETVRVELPEGVAFVPSSLTVNRSASLYTLEERTLTVPVLERKGTIRFYVLPGSAGMKTFYGSLLFDNEGETVVQPIGSCSVDAVAASIRVPSRTSSKSVTVSGQAIPNCNIAVYDNASLVGTTVSRGSGAWDLTFDLVRPLNYSLHNIYAVVNSSDYQMQIETNTSQLVYYSSYFQLASVTMINYAGQEYRTFFDFIHPALTAPSYSYASSSPSFTFLVRFLGNQDLLQTVHAVTTDSTGNKTYIPCTYDPHIDCWVGTHQFVSTADLPCFVSAVYETKEGTGVDPGLESSDQAEMMVYAEQAEQALEADMDEKVDVRDVMAEGETISFNITMDGKIIGYYQAEALDCANFQPSDWDAYDYAVIQFEDGTICYHRVESEGAYYVTYTMYPEDKLLIKESMTLISGTSSTDAKGLALAPNTFLRWYDMLKRSTDLLQAGADFVTDAPEIADHLMEYQNLNVNVYLLRDGVRRLRSRRDSCKCVDNSIYDEALAGLDSEISDYDTTLKTMLAGSLALIALQKLARFKIGKYIKGVVSGGYTKLYRKLQKQSGQSGRGQIIGTHKRGITSGSEGVSQLAEDCWDLILEKAGLTGLIGMIRQANQDYYTGIQSEIDSYIRMFKNLKCHCTKDSKGKCECYKEEPEEEQPVTPCVDPSGYVYEAVPSNRISDVKAEVYCYDYEYDEFGIRADEKSEIFWNAGDYGQVNPQYTNADGTYGWDVPAGQWVVKFSKDGYENADSYHDEAVDEEGYLPVPPIQTEVNTAIVSRSAPAVKTVSATPNEVRIEFSQYMQPATVGSGNVTVTLNGAAVAGTIEPLNEEADYQGTNTYASIFLFRTTQKMTGSVTVTIRNVRSYNGMTLPAVYQKAHKVLQKPEALQIGGADSILHHGDAVLEVAILPKEAGANRKISVVSCSPSIVSVQSQTVTTDQDGKANVLIHGNLPGQGALSFSLAETDLTEEKIITVDALEEPMITFEETAFPVTLSPAGCVYNGKAQKPSVAIEGLTQGEDFIVTYANNINAGTARISIQGLGRYVGTIEKTFTISKAKNTITASGKTVNASVKAQSLTLQAKATGGKITWKSGNAKVKVDAAGKVTIAAQFAGKVTITLTASDKNYQTATKKITLTVNQVANTITAANKKLVCSAKDRSFYLGVKRKGTGKITYKSSSKNVTVNSTGKITVKKNYIGKTTITISVAAAGMYKAAKKTATVTVNPAKTPLKSAVNATGRKLVVKWAKYAAGGGYQLQYSTSSKFASGNKTVTIANKATVAKTITGLKKGKTYYIRIRVFKTVAGVKYFSAWGTAKAVKITK